MKKLSEYAPPGADIRRDLTRLIFAAAVFILCWSLSFLFRYLGEIDSLTRYVNGHAFRPAGTTIPTLNTLMRHSFAGFWGYAAVCVIFAVSNYFSFRGASKSYIVMRRVKSGAELHVRSLTVPVLALLGGMLLAALLILIYILIYRYATPDKILPAYTGFDLWEALL